MPRNMPSADRVSIVRREAPDPVLVAMHREMSLNGTLDRLYMLARGDAPPVGRIVRGNGTVN